MTYRELLEKISKLNEEQLDDSVVVLLENECEFVGIDKTFIENEEDDVLHKGHLYLISN